MRYYSQNGEDRVLHELFRDKERGFFVEVGCIDGRRLSNTLGFEEAGWRGICVEAHGGFVEALRRHRPGSTVVHCAVGARDAGEVTFYANDLGSLSTLDAGKEAEFRAKYGEWFHGFEEQRVPLRTLNSILAEHGVADIDFISLDIEGHEAEALVGLDFTRWKPGAFVIECTSRKEEAALDRILLPQGYDKTAWLEFNLFYVLDSAYAARIRGRSFEAELIHTSQLDDSVQQIPASFTLRTPRRRGVGAFLQRLARKTGGRKTAE